ncbi:uncharacterized protein LOC112685357 isoform X2 [Sipha flava]|uniref:Uncharacterized protein LOC112685357 isoform X2 n=1 Tax=Sipha flava TaxID=143950 RepID=A0A8B8FR86_9HEMI|nr:uncharacterized protein LOC112685357 isoform X2 [Sipha flava]
MTKIEISNSQTLINIINVPIGPNSDCRDDRFVFRVASLTLFTVQLQIQYTEFTQSNVQTTEDFYRINAYYVILDTLVTKLKERFSNDSLQMGVSVDNFFQLKFEESQFFIDHYQGLLDLSKINIQSEMTVAKNSILQSGGHNNTNQFGYM